MRYFTLLGLSFGLVLAGQAVRAQTGIGTTTPRSMLDVNGAISVAETTAAVVSNAATVPTGFSLVRLTGTATGPVTLTSASSPAPVAGQLITIYNTTGFPATFGLQTIAAGQSLSLVYSNSAWQGTAGGSNTPTTASNGLTKTGSNIALGGTLTGATTIAQGGNAFSLTGGNVGIGTTTPTQALAVNGGVLASAFSPISDQGAYLQWNRSLGDGESWLLNQQGGGGANAGIRFGSVTPANVVTEFGRFSNNGFLGIGTAPSAMLDVNGSTRLRGLTTAGVVTTDANGNLSSGSAASLDPTTASNGLTKTGNNTVLGGTLTGATDVATAGNNLTFSGTGNVGIGTTGPGTALEVAGASASATVTGTAPQVRLSRATVGGVKYANAFDMALGSYATGITSQSQVDFNLANGNSNTPDMTVLSLRGNGNVGIGTTAPNAPLQFGNGIASRKVVMYEDGNNDHQYYGLGINSGMLRYQVSSTGATHAFFAGTGATASTELMRINGNGNVGIGTTAPAARLQVVSADNASTTNIIDAQANNQTWGTSLYYGGVRSTGTNANNTLFVDSKGAGAMLLQTNGGTGYVGIGTATPSQTLTVGGGIAALASNPISDQGAYLQWNRSGGDGESWLLNQQGGGGVNAGIRFGSVTSANVVTEFGRFSNNGFLGIGTAPSAMLDVNGSTRLRGLTTAGVVTTDANGNLSSGSAASLDPTTASNGLTKTGNNTVLGGTLTGATDVATAGNNLTFSGTGNVGIGTTGPGTALEVAGASASATVTGTAPQVRLSRATVGGVKYANAFDMALGSYATGITSQSQVDFNLANGNSNTPDMTVLSLRGNGHVGIGTTAPNAPLQFGNGIANREVVLYEEANNDHQYYGLGINGGMLRYQVSSTAATHAFFAGTGATASTELMRINGNGNVGIGTSSPTQKLDVAGNIHLSNALIMDNAQVMYSANAAGTQEPFFWPRWSDNMTYMNYGTGGFNIRNNASAPVLFMDNGGNVGISTTAPAARLQVVSADNAFGTNIIDAQANNLTYGTSLYYAGVRSTGTNANNDLYLDGKGAGNLILQGGGSTGNVGIGMNTPNAPLQFANTVVNRKIVLYDRYNNDNQYFGLGISSGVLRYQVEGAGAGHAFYAGAGAGNSTELMRINGDGKVGIGTNTPSQLLTVNGGILAQAYSPIMFQGAYLQWNRSGGDGETWLINQQGGGSATESGIRFGTATTANAVTEYGRFNYAGLSLAGSVFLNGNPTAGIDGTRLFYSSSANFYDVRSGASGTGTTSAHIFRGDNNTGGTTLMYLTYAGNAYANSFTNTSDARLKSEVKTIGYGLSTVMSIQPKQYQQLMTLEMKDGKPVAKGAETKHTIGFLAQELYKLVPEAVSKPTDEANQVWGVDYSKLVPVLTKAIQEQQAEIEALKTANTGLKASLDSKATASTMNEMQAALQSLRAEMQTLKAGTASASAK